MRKKIVAQRATFDQSIDQLTKLISPERILKRMDTIIGESDQILALVHEQMTGSVSNTGFYGMSAEQIFRVAVLRQLEQYSLGASWPKGSTTV